MATLPLGHLTVDPTLEENSRKPSMTAVNASKDRPARTAEHLGDLRGGISIEVHQHNREALVRRKTLQGQMHRFAVEPCLDFGEYIGARWAKVLALSNRLFGDSPASPTTLGTRHVQTDCDEPGSSARAGVSLKAGECPEIRLLHEIFGLPGSNACVSRDAVNSVEMRNRCLEERSMVLFHNSFPTSQFCESRPTYLI